MYTFSDIKVDSLKHVPRFTTSGNVAQDTTVTLHVGDKGPFTKIFPDGQNSIDIIKAWQQLMLNEVNAIVGC